MRPTLAGIPRLAAWLLALLCAAASVPARAASDADELQRIQRERREANERYERAVKACEGRFAVTACIERARAERRTTLDRLRQQQTVIDDAKRRERAAQRLESIQKHTMQADALGPEPAASAAQRAAKAPPRAPTPRTAKAPPAPSSSASRPAAHVDRQAEAARRQRRAAEAEQRRLDAEIHRRQVERRNAERDRQRPPAAPLPVPDAASAAR